MADFERFIEETHQRGIRVIVDLVLNHTSSAHPWFQESKSSALSPKRDWYIWKSPSDQGYRITGNPSLVEAPGSGIRIQSSITTMPLPRNRLI